MSLFDRMVVKMLPVVPRVIVGAVASRYVAGDMVSDAIETAQALAADGAVATMDILGEEVRDKSLAENYTKQYMALVDAIEASGISSSVSVKPTMLGLDITEELCEQNIERIFAHAAARNIRVAIDMEDHPTTDFTLRVHRRMHDQFGNAGTVLQAYMRRTLADIAALPVDNCQIRLCKGIYVEPESIAYKGYEEIRANYLLALEALFERGIFVGIATHDEYLVDRAMEIIQRRGLDASAYEFQMLLGVLPQLRSKILSGGHALRVYIPYGSDWYAYSVRRLRENPKVARHVMRAMIGLR
ncbi:proline dehydrogenase family protein [bacterium]|nr:proline dehydrogenase family protein [bacterium]